MGNKLSVHRAWGASIFVALLLTPGPAVAQKPTIVLLRFAGGVAPTQDVCGFDILVTPQEGRPNESTTMVVAMGPGVFWSHPLSPELAAAAGLPRVFLLDGRIVFTVDEQRNTISIESVTGTAQDLCRLLQ